MSKIQNFQMSISTVSTRPKFKISIKSKNLQKSKKVPKSPQGCPHGAAYTTKSEVILLDGSYQGRKKLTFLWPCPHRQPNLIKSEQICRKSKIEQILKNQLKNSLNVSKIQNVQMSISTVSTRPKLKISIKS